ncbi:hypothetical protein [Acidithiobacillus sp. AMEEHan]|uniref:hypothetical protein n=1 Tax=Acidithiobacillus sp. AMEEHan TaxID=2994951 RepID=UPI0027E40261|nr:hypothetical protein [Acidithiobacillus sp. AMEEHan]
MANKKANQAIARLTIAAALCLVSSSAFAWGPWEGWAPWDDSAGPFAGFGGPFTGSMGPWSMGSLRIQRPYGGPMRFSTGDYGAYNGPYQGYYGGASYQGGVYPPAAYAQQPAAYPPSDAYYGYPNEQAWQNSPASVTSFPSEVPPPPGPFQP